MPSFDDSTHTAAAPEDAAHLWDDLHAHMRETRRIFERRFYQR